MTLHIKCQTFYFCRIFDWAYLQGSSDTRAKKKKERAAFAPHASNVFENFDGLAAGC